MAKVKVIKMNFTDYLSEHMDKLGDTALLADALLGGKLKDRIKDLPNEQEIILDTDYVYATTGLVKEKTTGDIVFKILLSGVKDEDNHMWLKDTCYDDFIKAWTNKEGDKEHVVKKACDWLNQQQLTLPDSEKFIEDFKKAMEK